MKPQRIGYHVVLFFLVFSILVVSFPKSAFAITISVPSSPHSITNDVFTIVASVSGSMTVPNYIRVDLFKDGTTNYFGETYNGSSWVSGSDHTQYFPITASSGTIWNGNIQVRVGSPSSTEYDGNGTYKLRIRRYTSSGNYNNDEAKNSAVTIAIVIPTITPTPLPTHTPAPTARQSATATPTRAQTVTPTSIGSPDDSIGFPAVSSMPDFDEWSASKSASTEAVLADTAKNQETEKEIAPSVTSNPTPQEKVLVASYMDHSKIAMGIGFMLLTLSCGILFYRFKKNSTE